MNRLEQAIKEKGITQKMMCEMCEEIGYSICQSTLSNYIKDRNPLTSKQAFAFGKVLGVSPSWLLGLDDRRNFDNDWILCQDAIPLLKTKNGNKIYRKVMVSCSDGEIREGYYDIKKGDWVVRNMPMFDVDPVAWMNYPEPYKI